MALTQRELGEVAAEACEAARAFEELEAAVREALRAGGLEAEGRIVLLRHILRELPVVSVHRASAALEHIERTRKRNERRARRAREERAKEKQA
jgi:transcription elongation GreA/GreB family factor